MQRVAFAHSAAFRAGAVLSMRPGTLVARHNRALWSPPPACCSSAPSVADLPAGIDCRWRLTLRAASGSEGDHARGGSIARRARRNRSADGHLTCGLALGSDRPLEIANDRGPYPATLRIGISRLSQKASADYLSGSRQWRITSKRF